MTTAQDLFAIGHHRPVYLWAGPGTIRMNRLKFMGAPVDEKVHTEAHTPVGARRIAHEAQFNWAYLMYDWGFPPEIEQEDWQDFRKAVAIYHSEGVRVFGYVQTSNCVYDGSYRSQDWYAMDPQGRPFYYYTGRYMTCWSHPGWLNHLKEMVKGVIESGADGVFFDNPWHGAQPFYVGRAWLGPAGCYCPRCRTAFQQASGLRIPERIDPATDEVSRHYLRWRAQQVTDTLKVLADYARSLKADVVISANDFDAVMRPSYLIYGIDLTGLARVQDVMMIENFGLPRWDRDRNLLVNSALTLRTARALVGHTPLSVNPYDQGIGFDAVYPPRRFRQGLAEAAACGAVMVVKGTEFVEDGQFTLLTAERFAPQRKAIGDYHRWLAEHANLYIGRTNVAPVGLLYPGDDLWQAWDRWAPLYFGVGQTLLAAGIPWRVVTPQEDLSDLKALFYLDRLPPIREAPPGLRAIRILDLPGWKPLSPSFLAQHENMRAVASRAIRWIYDAYFRHRWMRRLADAWKVLPHRFLRSAYFRLPPPSAQQSVLNALDGLIDPRITSEAPVLVELWRKGEEQQLHLVNYASHPQQVTVSFERPIRGQVISPDDGRDEPVDGQSLVIPLDVYTIVRYREH